MTGLVQPDNKDVIIEQLRAELKLTRDIQATSAETILQLQDELKTAREDNERLKSELNDWIFGHKEKHEQATRLREALEAAKSKLVIGAVWDAIEIIDDALQGNKNA